MRASCGTGSRTTAPHGRPGDRWAPRARRAAGGCRLFERRSQASRATLDGGDDVVESPRIPAAQLPQPEPGIEVRPFERNDERIRRRLRRPFHIAEAVAVEPVLQVDASPAEEPQMRGEERGQVQRREPAGEIGAQRRRAAGWRIAQDAKRVGELRAPAPFTGGSARRRRRGSCARDGSRSRRARAPPRAAAMPRIRSSRARAGIRMRGRRLPRSGEAGSSR